MGDIVKAIEKEKEYISFRMNGEEPYHFVDAIKALGFKTLGEYFSAKKDYNFNQLTFELIYKNPNNCIDEGLRLLDTNTTAVVFVNCDETFVYTGESKPFNEAFCIENNIPIYPLHAPGGTIVGVDGDFSIGICVPKSLGVDEDYMKLKIQGLLSNYVDGITIDGNDILYNGNKICGITGYRKNGMYLFIAHCSFSDRTSLINEVCAVPEESTTFSLRGQSVVRKTDKVPGYIDFMSRDELREEVSKWLSIQQK